MFDGAFSRIAAQTPSPKVPEMANLPLKEIQAGAEFALLKELAAQRKLLSEQAVDAKQPDKARWEAELAQELLARADRAAASLEEAVRQRLGSQSGPPSAAAADAVAADPDEAAFLTRLDTQLWRVERDLQALLEQNKDLSAQLQTNNTPEEVVRISYLAQENNTVSRFLERERSGLELQKLQYRALRKAQQPARIEKTAPPVQKAP
jgi:hypothetical protein